MLLLVKVKMIAVRVRVRVEVDRTEKIRKQIRLMRGLVLTSRVERNIRIRNTPMATSQSLRSRAGTGTARPGCTRCKRPRYSAWSSRANAHDGEVRALR